MPAVKSELTGFTFEVKGRVFNFELSLENGTGAGGVAYSFDETDTSSLSRLRRRER